MCSLFCYSVPLLPSPPPQSLLPLPVATITAAGAIVLALQALLVAVLERADVAALVRAALMRDLVHRTSCPACSSFSCQAAMTCSAAQR